MRIQTLYPTLQIEQYVIMPNHVHLLLRLEEDGHISVGQIIKIIKGQVTVAIGHSIWQKSYYDHAIRNEAEYVSAARYIEENPLKWQLDELYISR